MSAHHCSIRFLRNLLTSCSNFHAQHHASAALLSRTPPSLCPHLAASPPACPFCLRFFSPASTMSFRIFLIFLVLLLVCTQALAAPTRYTVRYGKHDLKPKRRVRRRISPAGPGASELAELVRRRAGEVKKLRTARSERTRKRMNSKS